MAMTAAGLSTAILAAFQAQGFQVTVTTQAGGFVAGTKKLADALGAAIVPYLQANAQVTGAAAGVTPGPAAAVVTGTLL